MTDKGKPLYMIGVVADMLKLHPQTLRMYEKKGLIRPSRTEGQTRRYSAEDVEEIARVTRLAMRKRPQYRASLHGPAAMQARCARAGNRASATR